MEETFELEEEGTLELEEGVEGVEETLELEDARDTTMLLVPATIEQLKPDAVPIQFFILYV